ncbi:hypothetical protein [Desulfothermobacter acidiphilus]|uniref:hypothetical protein n=1 Tax=Desulfothermobacter acidiphilus TaxID=1938353 RepID=UPI003F8C0C82
MWRWLGAALLLLAGGMAGHGLSRDYSCRPRELRALVSGLQLLRTEINYAVPLPEALLRVGRNLGGEVGELFDQLAARLKCGGAAQGMESLWAGAVEQWRCRLALKEEDWEVLGLLAGILGGTLREEQERHLALAQERLELALGLAEEEARRYIRLYRFLGWGAGLGLAVLLI